MVLKASDKLVQDPEIIKSMNETAAEYLTLKCRAFKCSMQSRG